MSEERTIRVRRADGGVEEGRLRIAVSPPWSLSLSVSGRATINVAAEDLFDALCHLREQLEGVGAQLLCAGAQRNVFPSGMSRSMGGGRRAYVLRPGRRPTPEDLVDIFDEAEDLVTVREQREFYAAWTRSLQGGAPEQPFPGEVEEAKQHPNGWVYRIAGAFADDERVPPEAIVGAWKVDAEGRIIGDFVRNAKYDPQRWPAKNRR